MSKLQRIYSKMETMGLRQMLVSDPIAIFYISGKWIFPGERFLGLLLKKDETPILFFNELFKFDEDISVKKVYLKDTDDITNILSHFIIKDAPLGVDKILPARFLLPMMSANLATSFVNASICIDETRAIKDAAEIEKMRISSKINDKAMDRFKKLVKKDISEIEIADQMLAIYKELGAQAFSFDPIVAFGKNAADPHHMPDETVLKEGDCVLFDVGCKFENYCSDMTRTFFYKKNPTELEKKVYETVKRANIEAEEMLKPGIVISNIDKKARDIISLEGFGDMFTHRLGHFIGIEDHEYGDVSSTNDNITCRGNIFSIEPGIYYSGVVGVRIEDLVLITDSSYEVLNSYSKDLEIIE